MRALLAFLFLLGASLAPARANEVHAALDAQALELLLDLAPEATGWDDAPAEVFMRAQAARLGLETLRIPYANTVLGERRAALAKQTAEEGLTLRLRQAWHQWFTDWRAAVSAP